MITFEITPEMISAGAEKIGARVDELGPYSRRHLAEDVFRAMLEARKECLKVQLKGESDD